MGIYGYGKMTRKRRRRIISNKFLVDIFGDSSDAEKVVEDAFRRIEKSKG